MTESTNIEKIKRFCRGEANAEEERNIWSLFSEKEEDEEFRRYFEKEFEKYFVTHTEETHDLSFMIDHIHHIINLKKQQKIKKSFVRKIYKWYSGVAAILLVPIIFAGILLNKDKSKEFVTNEIVAPIGARVSFSLPDGTRGWLNSGSSLSYKIPFCKDRNVSVKGEAKFDVTYDSNHPFKLFAGVTRIKVLGTKFNVNAYPENHLVEVVLGEGKVEFSVQGISKGVIMKPNDRLVFKNDSISISQVNDPKKYGSWSEGKLIFQGDSMDQVVQRISRWYNVDVVLMDTSLKDYKIRGTFQDDPLKNVLEVLTMTSPIRYSIIGAKILKDGTSQKEKVLLYKN